MTADVHTGDGPESLSATPSLTRRRSIVVLEDGELSFRNDHESCL